MASSIWEKAISILAGDLNSGRSYIITAVYFFQGDAIESRDIPQAEFERGKFLAHTKYGTYYGAAANPWFLRLLPR